MWTWLSVSALSVMITASAAQAQTRTLAWDQEAPTVAAAQGYTYTPYVNDAVVPPLTGVTCTGATSPFVCQAPLPASIGVPDTKLELTAKTPLGGESLKSLPLFLAPAVPLRLRQQ